MNDPRGAKWEWAAWAAQEWQDGRGVPSTAMAELIGHARENPTLREWYPYLAHHTLGFADAEQHWTGNAAVAPVSVTTWKGEYLVWDHSPYDHQDDAEPLLVTKDAATAVSAAARALTADP